MQFKNVDVTLETRDVNPASLTEFKEALESLDVLIESEYNHYNEDYKKGLAQGKVCIRFCSEGVVEKNTKGYVVIINIGPEIQDRFPSVSVKGLEKLDDKNYKLKYEYGVLDIIKMYGHPTRYSIYIEKFEPSVEVEESKKSRL